MTGVSMHVGRVRELAPMVAELRGGFDAAGRLPDELVVELCARKLFRLWLPVSLGGLGLSALEFMDVVEEAASLDGTIGWLVGNGGGMSRGGAFLDPHAAHRIFDDPDAFVVSSTAARGRAERIEAGFVVSGRWAFGSGSPHATWFAPMCEVFVDGAPTGQLILVYVPRDQVVLLDNWDVSGLRATGSVDFELHDVVVEASFVDTFQPRPEHSATLYRLPTPAIFTWTVATVPLGIARGAVAAFVAMATSDKRRSETVQLSQREVVQSRLGSIVARLGASRAHLREVMTSLLGAIEGGGDIAGPFVEFRMACTLASQTALWAIDLLTEMAGAVSISRSSLLERFERDARAAAKHVAMSPNHYIVGGRHRLGLDPSATVF